MEEPVDVLYVEDDRPSVTLLEEAFTESAVQARVHSVSNAPDAVSALAGDDPDGSQPDLVLLDLDLGETSGFDVLEALEDREDLASPPVVVFSSSDASVDVHTAYERGANAYVRKPDDFEGLVEVASGTGGFWRSVESPAEAT